MLAGCHGAVRGARIESAWIHPLLAAPDWGGAPSGSASPPPPVRRPAAAAVATGPQAARSAVPLAAVESLPPASGDEARAELVESARRLVGIGRSFDERSFLGHVLRVNALLPAGARSGTWTASAHLKAARGAGRVVPFAESKPGDLLFFECASGCGVAGSEDGVAAGVVERVADGRVEVIAYVDGRVQRCWSGGERDPGPGLRRVEKVVAAASVTASR
ncbi:MAG: hypothetical protein FJ087_08675 [Deltaproteobacteria bacterium]|nr:hypothetical protein [Deltaproteobacteria bacterium]